MAESINNSMFLSIIFIGIVVSLLFVYLIGNTNERYWKKRGVKFHSKNKVTGVFWDYFTKKGGLFERYGDLYKEYKKEPAVGIGSIVTPTLFVIDPKNVQHILQADFNSFHHRGIDVSTENDQLADNLFFMSGPRWKLMRQNMTPLFTATKLKSMYYMMDKCAQDLVVYLKDNPKLWEDICINIQNNGTMKDPTTGTELEPTVEILTAQAMFFLIAGVEPVAIAIFATLVELGRNPHLLEKAHQEIDAMFTKYNNIMTYEVISEMEFIDKVLSEAMRINPPIGVLNRVCVKDTVLPVGNIKVDKGTKIVTPIYHLHNDPDVYPEPHVFDPERFAKGNKQNEEFYMPFGMGGRMCIGARYSKLQMAAGLVHILRHFTVNTKELGGPVKFRAHVTSVRPIDADVLFIPRNIK